MGGLRCLTFERADVTGLKDNHGSHRSLHERLADGEQAATLLARPPAKRGAMTSQVLGSTGGGDRAAKDSHRVNLCPQSEASWKTAY